MKKIIRITIGFLVMFLHEKGAVGQATQQTETKMVVTSSFNAKNYVLHISLPAFYSADSDTRYSVLYVLDGNYSFASFHSLRQILDMGNEIEEVIIVAIGDETNTFKDWLANRHNDFTTSQLAQADAMFDKFFKMPEGTLHSGGADLFLKTLKTDIMKRIEKAYRTNGDNGLSGHSLGGLFAGYCLLVEPDLFSRYGINSPSFWWDPHQLKNLQTAFAKAGPGKKTNIFISAGKLEGEMMLAPIASFNEALRLQNDSNLKINYHIFDDETHLSVVPACSSRTLKVLYGNNAAK